MGKCTLQQSSHLVFVILNNFVFHDAEEEKLTLAKVPLPCITWT